MEFYKKCKLQGCDKRIKYVTYMYWKKKKKKKKKKQIWVQPGSNRECPHGSPM